MADTLPTDFDWVTALSKCSLYEVFQSLREVVARDVKTAQVALTRVVFTLPTNNDTKIHVSKQWDATGFTVGRAVSFDLGPNSITVHSVDAQDRRLMFSAVPSLNQEGRCRLSVNDEELELWQVSRKALEGLFFS